MIAALLVALAIAAFTIPVLALLWTQARQHLRQKTLDNEKLIDEKNELQDIKTQAESEKHVSREVCARLEEALRQSEMRGEKSEIMCEKLRDELGVVREENAQLKTEKKESDIRHREFQEEMKNMHTLQKDVFGQLAQRIFQSQHQTFQTDAQKNLSLLLKPFREQVQNFEKSLEQKFTHELKGHAEIRESIRALQELHKDMGQKSDNLARAIKGDNKTQGYWGEQVLVRVLEAADLREGRDYTTQGQKMSLSHVEHGGRMKPDVIVHLPEGRNLVIDAKVSLKAYEQFCSSQDQDVKDTKMKDFLNALRRQIQDLSTHRYQDIEGMRAPDFVFMFVSAEGAYMAALEQDPDLHGYAWERRIVLASPTTLFASMRIVSSLWRINRQNRNAQNIAKQAGHIYDKLVAIIEGVVVIGEKLDSLKDLQNKVIGQLSTGKGNVVNRLAMIKTLGAQTTKNTDQTRARDIFAHQEEPDNQVDHVKEKAAPPTLHTIS